MALGIQNTLDGFAGSADHSLMSLEMENKELIRQNTELKLMAHKELIRQNMELKLMANMALMQENFALAQAQALLACQVQASKTLPEVRYRTRRSESMTAKSFPGKRKIGASADIRSSTNERISAETTSTGIAAIMRNIPAEYTRKDVLELVDEHGFQGSYVLFYLPVRFEDELNLGYALIHFATAESYERFQEHFTGFSDWKIPSDRICEVESNEKFNNLDNRIEGYRNSPIMHESVEDKFKPVLFAHGQRIPFPEPTKYIKAPRHRRGRKSPKNTN